MSAYKDNKTGKWYCFFYYHDFTGKNKGKTKRGFETKREALEWERSFKQTQSGNLEMSFGEFILIYHEDIRSRIKHNTWLTKKNITDCKILPYFADKTINNIRPADVIKWQNIMLNHKDEKGNSFSPVYLKTLHNQLSAIFNHAVRFYSLKDNPAQKAGNMGKDYITSPKTEKSNRVIKIPDFLAEELNEYINTLYKIKPNDRLFEVTKHFLHNEMTRGSKIAEVQRIRIHDIRHSAISLLIDLGFSAVAIASRVGHESIDITYRYAHLFPSKQIDMANQLSIERGGTNV